MPTTAHTIDHATLAHLAGAGAVRGVRVVGKPGGWGVLVQYGTTERALSVNPDKMRIWKKFETLVSYLKEFRIDQFHIDTKDYDPSVSIVRRADTSARMKAAHDSWSRAKAEQSLADPRPNVSHAQVMADAQAVIDAKRKTRASKTAVNGTSRT